MASVISGFFMVAPPEGDASTGGGWGGEVSTMTSGILEVPAQLLFGHSERGDSVVAEPGQEESPRDSRKLGRGPGGQLSHLEKLGCGGHAELAADLLLRNLQGQERVFRNVQYDLTHRILTGSGSDRCGSILRPAAPVRTKKRPTAQAPHAEST